MFEISITPQYAIAWFTDSAGVRSIHNVLENYEKVLKLPKRSAEGKTGKDIRWTAYETARIVHDGRVDA